MSSLSVIIPNFNHARYLPAVVESCFSQAVQPDEVIVVDDASTDDSRIVLTHLASRFHALRVVAHEGNRGPAAALNTGVDAAGAEWVLLRAADDLCTPSSFATCRQLAAQFPAAGLITGDVVVFERTPLCGVRECLGRARTPVCVSADTFVEGFGGNIIHGAASFVRASWVRDERGFDESLRWHCDWFLLMALGLSRGFIYAPEVLGAIRLSPHSYNARGTADESRQSAVLDHLLTRLEQNPELLERFLAVGCLDFFGEPLRHVLRRASPERRERFAPLLAAPIGAVLAARNATGLARLLREFLSSQFSRIRAHSGGVAIFGAGGHTRHLLAIWHELDLPRPVVVLETTATGRAADLDGIPVCRPIAAKDLPRPLVILSSKSYEPLFASTMDAQLPGVPYLKIWGAEGD